MAVSRVAGWLDSFRTSRVTADPLPTAVTGAAGGRRANETGGWGVKVGVGVTVNVVVVVDVGVKVVVAVGVKVAVKVGVKVAV